MKIVLHVIQLTGSRAKLTGFCVVKAFKLGFLLSQIIITFIGMAAKIAGLHNTDSTIKYRKQIKKQINEMSLIDYSGNEE